MKRTYIALIAGLLVGMAGCLKPEPVLYRVSLGMSEKRLMEALGPPLSVKEGGDGKTLEYESWTNNLHGRPAHMQKWHVHLSAGKVDSYGMDEAKA